MSVEEIVKHCVENTTIHEATQADYKIEESEDDENIFILHGGIGFLTPELTEKLRKRLIFVDASSSSYEDDYSVMYFLHYLEPKENTFMDSLAEPVSTENSIEAVTAEIEELPTAGFDLSHLEDPPEEKIVKEEDAVLFQKEKGKEVAIKSDIHLWLADLKKEIDFDSHEEAEGARKLVEQAAFNLGTHGRQILQEELEEGDSSEQ